MSLKVEIECLACIIHRGYLEIAEATPQPHLQFRAATALLEYMAKEFNPEGVAAIIGTMRDRIIKRITGTLDIYAEKKRLSNEIALKMLPSLEEVIERQNSPKKRFRKACLASIVGNIIEFDIPEHDVNFNELKHIFAAAEADLAIDDILGIFEEAEKSEDILFLTDNAGEIAFDKLLVKELRHLGAKVTVVVKGGPILNDATLEDAKVVNMYEIANEIITTGSDAVGLPLLEEQSYQFKKAYNNANFVVAKGMGYAETLTEMQLTKPHAFLLRTKCNPVARYFKVARGKNVARLMKP